MKLSKAMSKKISNICKEKCISPNMLSTLCCITQSTVQNLISEKSHNPKLLTIVRICEGLGITLKDFFDDKVFLEIERED